MPLPTACLSAVLAVLLGCAAALADDGVTMTVRPGVDASEVRLDWTGGQPTYKVYRSADKTHIVLPANELGETTGLAWLDTPPAGDAWFYRVVGPCLTPTPEVCDGVDDDCDGRIDNGCPGVCFADADCPASEYCGTSGTCVPDLTNGSTCGRPEQCATGVCVDGVCCDLACGGLCHACDLAGSIGTCATVPNGQDPRGECGAVSCAGFYDGFSGDDCLQVADVPAGVAACDGAGSCRTAAQECTMNPAPGPVTLTCNTACQDPTAGTCTGTTPGACTNLDPGNFSCGQGVCTRTVSVCVNGVPNVCTPGTPQLETCNDLDDNCDGIVDNGPFGDPYEPNNDCASVRTLSPVGSDQSQTVLNANIYGSGDVDVFLVHATESDSICPCPFLKDGYDMSATLTVPVSSGSYELCMNTGSCTFPAGTCVTVASGQTLTVTQFLSGSCVVTDMYDVYIRVRGAVTPGFNCHPYTLTYTFEAGVCQ